MLNMFTIFKKVLQLSVPLFLVFNSSVSLAQNPALPPDSCVNAGAIFKHFEYDNNALRLYYQSSNTETVRIFSPDGNLLSMDTIHIDSTIYYTIQNDSVLVGKRLNIVVSEQTLPQDYWINNHFVQPSIPVYGAVSVLKKDIFYYFLWMQHPVSTTFNGAVWITKTNEQFLPIAELQCGQFQTFEGIHYFGLLTDELIGLSYSTQGPQGWKYSNMILAGLDLTVKKTHTNSSNNSNILPGNGLAKLPNQRFTYTMGLSVGHFFHQNPQSYETHHTVVEGYENNMIVPISEVIFNYKVQAGTPKQHFLKTEFRAYSDEGYITQGNSNEICYVNPLLIIPNPSAGIYYAVDSLYCATTLPNADSMLFTRFSFLSCLGVVALPSHTYALFNDGSIVDINCASNTNQMSYTYHPVLLDTHVFPNPALDMIHIENAPMNARFRIKNYFGQVCLESKTFETNTQISLDGLAAGLYFLEIEDTNHHQVTVYKIVKRRFKFQMQQQGVTLDIS
jgi:Secretion system C-terminal sorting domain